MTAKWILTLLLACSVCVSGFVPSVSHAAEPIVWKLASIYAAPVEGIPHSKGVAVTKFAEEIEKRTNGRMKIEVYWNSILGGVMEIYDQMRMGELELFYGQPLATSDKRFGVWSIPFLYNSKEEAAKIGCDPNGELFKLTAKWIDELDGKLLAVGSGGLRGFVNTKKMIQVPEDAKGLKCRVTQDPVVNAFWDSLCIASPIPLSELYTTFQTGVVDGTEFPATAVLTYKLYEVSNNYSDVDWQWIANASLIANKEIWAELPDDLKEIVAKTAYEILVEYQVALEHKYVDEAYADLEKRGTKVYKLTPEERAKWRAHARSMDGKLRELIGPEFDEVVAIVDRARAAAAK